MSSVAVSRSMPYSEQGLQIVTGVTELIERRRHRELVEWVTEICKLRHAADGEPLTFTELSIALDVYAPKLGSRGGNSMVSRWVAGSRSPQLRHRVSLQQIIRGILRLAPAGMDGSRHIYELVGLKCPKCGQLGMMRRAGKEVCSRCGHTMPAVEAEGVLVYDPELPPDLPGSFDASQFETLLDD